MPSNPMIAGFPPLVTPQVPLPPVQSVGTFTGRAPSPSPYGAFSAPDPANYTHDPGFQANLDLQQKSIQRAGAARGSLLSGGLLNRLQANASGLAAQDYGNQFQRALAAYNANRDTQAQNFGQSMQEFQGNLGAFGANTTATMGNNRFELDRQQTQYDQGRQGAIDTQANAQGQATTNAINQANAQQASDASFAAQAEAARRQNEAYTAATSNHTQAAPIGGTIARPGPVPRALPIGRR
jgi:hypothetical protein